MGRQANGKLKQKTNIPAQKNIYSGPGVTSTPESPLHCTNVLNVSNVRDLGQRVVKMVRRAGTAVPSPMALGLSIGMAWLIYRGGRRSLVAGVHHGQLPPSSSLSSGHGRTGGGVPAGREVSRCQAVCQLRSLTLELRLSLCCPCVLSTLTAGTGAAFLQESQLSLFLRLCNDEARACKVPRLHHYSRFTDSSTLLKIYGFRHIAQLVECLSRIHKALDSILSIP